MSLDSRKEKNIRKLWRMSDDDIIKKRGMGIPYREAWTYHSDKTKVQLGYDDVGFQYSNPYYEIGRALSTGITISETRKDGTCYGVNMDELCLCVEDLIILNDAIEETLEVGAENVSEETKNIFSKYREKCPVHMRLIRMGLEEEENFQKFFIEGLEAVEVK